MKAIVIFGAGKIYEVIKEEIKKESIISAVVDNYKKGDSIDGLNIADPNILKEIEYDYILITSLSRYSILKQLAEMNIDYQKIRVYYPEMDFNGGTIIEVNSDYSIDVNFNNININLKTLTEYNVFETIFIDRDYEIGLDETIPSIVIDVGMNVGMASLFFANKDYVKKVYSFEPFTETFNRGLKNFATNYKIAQKIEPFNIGLDDYSEVKYLKYNADISGSMRTYGDSIALNKGEQIKIERASKYIREILNENKDNQIILKMDCEGSEFGIFRDLEKDNLFHEIDIIVMEFHIENGGKIEDLEVILKKNKFIYFTRTPFTNKNVGYIYAVKKE